MKFYTSYFYQIRNFPKNLVPLSTAVWDPAWYHGLRADYPLRAMSWQSKIFIDKRGILNGLKYIDLVPDETCNGLCHGPEECLSRDPNTCQFLQAYRKQLDKLDFNELITTLEKSSLELGNVNFAFIFYETPDNPCSERHIVKQWFKDHNYFIEEFNKKTYEN